ncbi:phospholipase D-like domain-containing protein [Chlamydia trachomatis]|uniref:phospholipase D-like domain-containing protein n=1 Tax=Chlamydia trachomatis TaxID=813 RepID=UPI00059BE5BA|nr:phospholipase D-like domain-containing protein [Chlamydia trachomatis]
MQLQKFKATNQVRLHCKNIVVDGSLVITGSANFSDAAFSRDINLVAIIRNPSLGQLVVSQQSGWITGGSQQIEYCSLYYHNHQGVDKVVKAVQSAVKTIRVAILVLSHKEVLHALHQAAQRGVEVTVLVNPHNKAIPFYALQDLNSKVKLRDVVVEEKCTPPLQSRFNRYQPPYHRFCELDCPRSSIQYRRPYLHPSTDT